MTKKVVMWYARHATSNLACLMALPWTALLLYTILCILENVLNKHLLLWVYYTRRWYCWLAGGGC